MKLDLINYMIILSLFIIILINSQECNKFKFSCTMFDITGKVALVTGGASGIGFVIVKELLRNGLKGCTLADINDAVGQDAVEEINREFGENRGIFVRTDVTDKAQFEDAFKATIDKFRNIDILINNAGILNDSDWERTIQINLNGTINGILLGMENYLQHNRNGSEGAILNISSIAGLDAFISFPVYSSTKFAVVGLTQAFGAQQHYDRTKVKVLAICPGITNTPMVAREGIASKVLGQAYRSAIKADIVQAPFQEPVCVGKAVVEVIKSGDSGSAWVAEGSEPPYEITMPSRRERRKN